MAYSGPFPIIVKDGGTGSASFTAYGPVVAAATTTGALTSVTPSATSGVPLISGGSSANPSFGTVVVAGGGTGAVTLTGVLTGNGTSAVTASAVTQYAVLVGGASNAVGSVADVATGAVLVSGGTSANPAFSTTPTVTSITFGAGSALSTYVAGTSGSWTPAFAIGGSASGFTYGTQIGNYTQIGNVVFFTMECVCVNKGSGTGNLTITGWPVAFLSTIYEAPVTEYSGITLAGYTTFSLQPTGATSITNVKASGSGETASAVSTTNATLANGMYIVASGHYFTS